MKLNELVNQFAESKLLDKPTLSVESIAKKHGVSVEYVNTQLKAGIKIESEHTSDPKIAREIASDHLSERPDYYVKLKKVEVDESTNSADFKDMLKVFLPHAKKTIGLDKLPKIILKKVLTHGDQPTMGRFHDDTYTLELAIANRQPVDILRTLAHELVHAKQHSDHIDIDPSTGSSEENDANVLAGIVMRNFNKAHPEFLKLKPISEGGNLASHTPTGEPTVGYQAGLPGVHKAEKIDAKNRAAMVPVVKQLLVDINNTFARQYGRVIWNSQLLDEEVQKFISGSSKWFMFLRQPNPNFDPKQLESDANPKLIGIEDERFQRVKKKVGDIDTQIDRTLESQITEFLQKNNGKSVGSAVLVGYKAGSDQYLAHWKLNDPPITLQVDLEFSDYEKDERGFEVPTEWAQVSHGSQLEDLEEGIKGVFRQWLYRSLAKIAPTSKYIAKLAGRGGARKMQLFGGDEGKDLVVDINNPPSPAHDANFSFAVASVGGGGVRAKYRAVTPEDGIPTEVNGVPVMISLSTAESDYIKDMSQQFEQFFGRMPEGNERTMMSSLVGTVDLMQKYFEPNQLQVAVQEFLKINFGAGAQMIEADNPTEDFKIKMTAIDYLLDNLGMKPLRKQAVAMAKQYEQAYGAKKKPIAEAIGEAGEDPAVKAQLRKGMPHLRDLKSADFLDLLDELHQGNGQFQLKNIPLNVKVDGFGGRFGKDKDGKPFMGTSRTEPRYKAGFLDYHEKKGTTDPDVLGRAKLFDDLFNEMMKAVKLVDSKLGPNFLINKQVTCEVLYLPFATQTPEGKLKFVGIHYDALPSGVQLALVPFRVVDAATGEDLPNSQKVIKALTEVGKAGSIMFIDNSLTQNEALDVTAIVPPLENIEQLKAMLASKKRDQAAEVKAALEPVKVALEDAIIKDPNIIGKDLLGKDYEGIVINSRMGPIKITSQEQRDVISAKNAAKVNARTERPRGENKTAVVAIGSFVGHVGHEQLFDYTVKKAAQVGGDPYLFIGNAVGKDDPIPVATKVQTWHKLYPKYANNISAVTQEGGSLMQKIKHELINPLPGKPPRYDNVIIMVGEDQAGMNIAQALMKAVNKFPGYEHVKVSLEATPRGTGMSFSQLRNILKDPKATPQQQLATWSKGFDVKKLGAEWIKHLMDITKKGMGIKEPAKVAPAPQQKAEEPIETMAGVGMQDNPERNATAFESKKTKQRLDPKCWKGYKKSGTKMKGGTRVNNCVKIGESYENQIASLIEQLKKK